MGFFFPKICATRRYSIHPLETFCKLQGDKANYKFATAAAGPEDLTRSCDLALSKAAFDLRKNENHPVGIKVITDYYTSITTRISITVQTGPLEGLADFCL